MVYEEEQAKRRPRVSVRVHGERPLVFTFFIYPHDASTEDKTAGNTTPHRTAPHDAKTYDGTVVCLTNQRSRE